MYFILYDLQVFPSKQSKKWEDNNGAPYTDCKAQEYLQ